MLCASKPQLCVLETCRTGQELQRTPFNISPSPTPVLHQMHGKHTQRRRAHPRLRSRSALPSLAPSPNKTASAKEVHPHHHPPAAPSWTPSSTDGQTCTEMSRPLGAEVGPTLLPMPSAEPQAVCTRRATQSCMNATASRPHARDPRPKCNPCTQPLHAQSLRNA